MSKMKRCQHHEPFLLESGERLRNLQIAYHTYGERNKNDDNIIWVFHALSANSDVLEWWPGLFGEGCLYDPARYFIICVNTIGSPYGSSKPDDLLFPHFTVRDIVSSQLLLAKELAINKIHTTIGGSFGGNQALEFSIAFTGNIKHMVLVASCAKESAWSIASHEAQRLALRADPTFGALGGGSNGLKAARAMALLHYRTASSFVERHTDLDDRVSDFNASSYIRYQGEKFVKRFDALSYYWLIHCLDTHNVGRNRGGVEQALGKIKIPTLVIGIDTDQLIPTIHQKFLTRHMPCALYEEIHSDFGHDGFLIETKRLSEVIQGFYASSLASLRVIQITDN